MVIPPRRWLVVSHQWSLQETKLYTQHRAHKNHSALTRRESLGVEDKQNIPRTMARCGTMKKHWERKHWNFTPLHMDSLVSNLQTHYLQLFFIATQQLQVFRHIVWMPQFCISKGLNSWSDVTHNPGIGKDTIPAAWYWWVMVRPNLLKVSWLFQRKPSAYLKCSYVRRLHALGVITCIISALNLWMEIYWRYIYIYIYLPYNRGWKQLLLTMSKFPQNVSWRNINVLSLVLVSPAQKTGRSSSYSTSSRII